MKNKIIIPIVLICSMFIQICGCQKQSDKNSDQILYANSGAEDTEITFNSAAQEQNNSIDAAETLLTSETESIDHYRHKTVTQHCGGGEVNYVESETDYDSFGNTTCHIWYNSDGSIEHRTEYQYDLYGNCIKSTWYDDKGNIILWYDYQYNESNDETKMTCFDAKGIVTQWTEYQYNARNKVVKTVDCYVILNRTDITENEYDNVGHLVKKTKMVNDIISEISEYDSGNKIKYSDFGQDGILHYWKEYEYDDAGDEIKCTKYLPDGTISSWEEYERDADGNKTKYIFHNADGTYHWTEYEYTSSKMTKKTKYDTDGSVSKIYTHEYNEHGNKTKESEYHPDGYILQWTEYDYVW